MPCSSTAFRGSLLITDVLYIGACRKKEFSHDYRIHRKNENNMVQKRERGPAPFINKSASGNILQRQSRIAGKSLQYWFGKKVPMSGIVQYFNKIDRGTRAGTNLANENVWKNVMNQPFVRLLLHWQLNIRIVRHSGAYPYTLIP